MPSPIRLRPLARSATALAALAALIASPAAVASPGTPAQASMAATSCDTAQVFLPFGDAAGYVAAVNGGFEADLAGWNGSGGARVVDANEPWAVAGPGVAAVELKEGASVTGRFPCSALTAPVVRLFARNLGDGHASLRIELLYRSATGAERAAQAGTLVGSAAWGVTPPMAYALPAGATVTGIRLSVQGRGALWQVDDVFVDPYRRV